MSCPQQRRVLPSAGLLTPHGQVGGRGSTGHLSSQDSALRCWLLCFSVDGREWDLETACGSNTGYGGPLPGHGDIYPPLGVTVRIQCPEMWTLIRTLICPVWTLRASGSSADHHYW